MICRASLKIGLHPASLAAAIFCLFAAKMRADDDPLTQKSGPATLILEAKQHDGKLLMPYAPVPLTLIVEGTAPLHVKAPAKWIVGDGWTAFAKGPAREVPLAAGRARWEQTVLVEPLTPGEHALQIEPLEYQEKGGPWQTVRWKPIPVTVRPSVTEADASHLRDITSIEDLPPRPSGWSGWLWPAALAALAVSAILGFWVWRRRRVLVLNLSPEEWARRELDRLLALNLPARGQSRRFHALLSNVLRHYIERRFALPARRQTTPEFFDMVSKDHQFTPEQQTLLREVFERLDLAKFAGVQPAAGECNSLVERVRHFLTQSAISLTASARS